MAYPVRTERTFGPIIRPKNALKLPGKRQRSAEDIPVAPPGHVIVLRLADEYLEVRRQMSARDDDLMRASASLIIDERETNVEVRINVDGSTGADRFTVIVGFLCLVEDAKRVAERGGRDIEPFLRSYISSDPDIRELASRYTSRQLTNLRRTLAAQVRAFYAVEPPRVSGLQVSLQGVEVVTPSALTKADEDLRRLEDDQTLQRNRAAFEREQAGLLNDFILGDPDEMARKLSLVAQIKGEVQIRDIVAIQQQLAREAHEASRAQQELRVQFATALVERGFFDRTQDALSLIGQLWKSGLPIGDAVTSADSGDIESGASAEVGAADSPQISARTGSEDSGVSDSDYEMGR